MKKILIAMAVICCISFAVSVTSIFIAITKSKQAEVHVTSITYTKKEAEEGGGSTAPDENPSEGDEPIIFADKDGNTYELIKYVTDIENKKLVLLQGVETKKILLVARSHFDQNYHKVSG